ncbi:MAG: hypothetical protein HC933_04955 [Pleurocapsa sp. SU_196_0]|nr:hypothetical protein [Pleurocapsa sp. SU_196_0]
MFFTDDLFQIALILLRLAAIGRNPDDLESKKVNEIINLGLTVDGTLKGTALDAEELSAGSAYAIVFSLEQVGGVSSQTLNDLTYLHDWSAQLPPDERIWFWANVSSACNDLIRAGKAGQCQQLIHNLQADAEKQGRGTGRTGAGGGYAVYRDGSGRPEVGGKSFANVLDGFKAGNNVGRGIKGADLDEFLPLIGAVQGASGIGNAAKPQATSDAPVQVGTKGTGTNTVTTYSYNGTSYQVNSGHGFNRPHRSGDFANTNLSQTAVENAVIYNLDTRLANGVQFPPSGPLEGVVFMSQNGELIPVGYRAVQLPNGTIAISTYWPQLKP